MDEVELENLQSSIIAGHLKVSVQELVGQISPVVSP